jgi:hypothetical protein
MRAYPVVTQMIRADVKFVMHVGNPVANGNNNRNIFVNWVKMSLLWGVAPVLGNNRISTVRCSMFKFFPSSIFSISLISKQKKMENPIL